MSIDSILFEASTVPSILVTRLPLETSACRESEWAQGGLVVRHVRGNKMRTFTELNNEFAAAFQFPWYFGENSGAFDECIGDLSWLPSGRGYVVNIHYPGDVLASEDDGLRWFVRRLEIAQSEWAATAEQGEGSDRPPIPFHAVLHAGLEWESVWARWESAGAKLMLSD